MARYRAALPQLTGDIFLTDGGIETTLVFHHGLELPHFAAFDLLRHEEGREALRQYFGSYMPHLVGARRLLRHRSSPCRSDQRGLRRPARRLTTIFL